MSAGRFQIFKYAASYESTRIHPVKLQPETVFGTNTEPGGAINNSISAKVSRSRNGIGLRPRGISIVLPASSTPPPGYAAGSRAFIVILQQTVWEGPAYNRGATVTYLGQPWTIVNKHPEYVG